MNKSNKWECISGKTVDSGKKSILLVACFFSMFTFKVSGEMVANYFRNESANTESSTIREFPFQIGKSQESNIKKELGVSFWIKPSVRNTQRMGILINKDNFNIAEEKNGIILAYCGKNSWHGYQTYNALQPGIWQHVTISFRYGEPASIKCYINGTLKQGVWYAGSGDELSSAPLKNKIQIGQAERMDLYDIRIYDQLLTEKEAARFYAEKAEALNGGKITGLSGEEESKCLSALAILKSRIDSISDTEPLKKYWKAVLLNEVQRQENELKANSLEVKPEIANEKIKSLENWLEALSSGKLSEKYMVPYIVSALSNRRILPTTANIKGVISDRLNVIAAPGEYEAASFVIQGMENIEGLKLDVGDLKLEGDSGGKSIPASAVDIKVVKCWYQDLGISAEGWLCQEAIPNEKYNPTYTSGINVLVPELLLYDDDLVKVDHEGEENYLKLKFNDNKVEYVLPFASQKGLCYQKNAFPFYDSKKLCPVNIEKSRNKQFWITIKVPDNAVPGIYEGDIKLGAVKPGDLTATLKLKLRVLPFTLAKACYIPSIYYYCPDVFYKDQMYGQLVKELRNLRAHGVTNPPIAFWGFTLKEYLDARKSVGIDNSIIFYQKNFGNPTDPEKIEEVKKKVKEIIDIAKPYGTKDFYFHALDEAKGELLLSQRLVWEAVHQAGGKIFVAGHHSSFNVVGDIQDAIVLNGYPDKKQAADWHRKGHLIFNYANPQAGVEQAETYRRNMGLLLWQYDYDGPMPWVYYTGFPSRNDRHIETTCHYKQSNMVYPTADGVIDTVQWEGYREGIDDVRYVTTLQNLVAEESASGSPAVKKAEEYLKKLKEMDLSSRSLDTIRLEIIQHILKIKEMENK